MFAYCNNNPISCSDSQGARPVSILERFGNKSIAVPNQVRIDKPKKKTINTKLQQTCKLVIDCVEVSAGIGMGLYAEGEVLDVGLGLGIYYNPLNLLIEDGRFQLNQEANMRASASAVLHNLGYSMSKNWSYDTVEPDVVNSGFYPDDSLSILEGSAYFIAGGSFRIGFDIIQFCENVNSIYED